MTGDGLVEFLTARYDETEANERSWAASRPVGQHEEWCRGGGLWHGTCDECGCAAVPGEISPEMLADLESKRMILSLTDKGCGDDYGRVRKALALPYADHPDFRPEWRPTR